MDGVQISEILIKNRKKICTSKDILEIAKENYLLEITKLINTNWITRIVGFKGIYYVRDADERQSRVFKLDPFQILIRVLSIRFGDEWYFGRVTALSLSGVIHQPVSTYYVINKHRSKVIDSKLFGKVVLIKISANTGKPYGVLEQSYRGIPYYLSSIQRNLTDYLYLYTHGHADLDQIKDIYMNYRGMMNQDDLLELMYKCYQKNSAIKMVFVLKMVTK